MTWIIALLAAALLSLLSLLCTAIQARLIPRSRFLYFLEGILVWLALAMLLGLFCLASVCLSLLGTRGYAPQSITVALIVAGLSLFLLIRGGRRSGIRDGHPVIAASCWRLRPLLIVTGLLLIITWVVIGSIDARMKSEVSLWRNQMNAEYAKMLPPLPADEHNAALRYKELFPKLESVMTQIADDLDRQPASAPSIPSEAPALRHAADNDALPSSLRDVIKDSLRQSALNSAFSRADISASKTRQWVRSLEPVVGELCQAGLLPACRFSDGGIPPLSDKMEEMSQFTHAALAMSLAARAYAADHNMQAALEMVKAMRRLACHLNQDKLILPRYLAAAEIHTLANQTIASMLQSARNLDEIPDDLPLYVPAEREITNALAGGRLYASRIAADVAENASGITRKPFPALGFAYRMLWLHADREIFDEFFQSAQSATNANAKSLASRGSAIALVALIPLDDVDCVRKELTAAAAQLAVLRDLARYRFQTGQYPSSLAEAGLSAPTDPFDGKPMRYQKSAAGVVLYSVGRNAIDEHGLVAGTSGPGLDFGFRLLDDHRP